jgi:protein-S-isoprenylcysteine O-methyltransferase Ste14
VLTTILGYLLIGVFLATEGRWRKSRQARRLDGGQFDRRSTGFIGVAFFVSGLVLLLAPVLNNFGMAQVTSDVVVGWVGLVIAALGIMLRLWANRILGAYYTRTLLVAENQTIVENGPYRMIRHPGYLGSILMWVGTAIATTNWIAVSVAVVMMFSAYAYRIHAEEAMLMTANPQQYGAYKTRTWKLIPYVY